MALLSIRTFPDPVLKRAAQPVGNIDGSLANFVDSLVQTMYAAPGLGLAAPQVGDSRRVIVLDVDHESQGKRLLRLINPRIVEAEGSIVWQEGCLSVRDFNADVRRAARVLVKAVTLDQREIEVEADDVLAVVLQHEIDHLEGKLFIDRISRIKRELYRKRLAKMIKEGKTDEERPSPARL